MKHGISVEGGKGGWAARGAADSRGQTAAEGYLGLPAKQQAVAEVNAGCRVAAGGLYRIQADKLGLAGLCPRLGPGDRLQFDGQLRGLQVAGKMRIGE